MQLTNKQVTDAYHGLTMLSNQKVQIKLAWKITTAIRSLTPFATKVGEVMEEIQKKYALKNADGTVVLGLDEKGNSVPNTMQIPPTSISQLNTEITDFLNQLVEVHNVQIKTSDFPDDISIEPAVLTSLSSILVTPSEN